MKNIIHVLLVVISVGILNKDKWDDDKSDWSSLMIAVYNEDDKSVVELIKKNDSLTYETKGTFYLNALIVGIKKGNFFAVKKLYETNKFMNLDDYLAISCLENSSRIVEFFIEKGARINKYSDNGHSNLMSACISGSPEVLKSLLDHGAEINHQRTVDGITALMLATFNGNLKKVEILIDFGADKTIKNSNGKVALDYIDEIYPRLNVSDQTKIKLRDILLH